MKTLKELRTDHRMTLDEMAELIGTTKTAYFYYENGSRKVPAEVAHTLSKFFNVEVEDIFLPSTFSLR